MLLYFSILLPYMRLKATTKKILSEDIVLREKIVSKYEGVNENAVFSQNMRLKYQIFLIFSQIYIHLSLDTVILQVIYVQT